MGITSGYISFFSTPIIYFSCLPVLSQLTSNTRLTLYQACYISNFLLMMNASSKNIICHKSLYWSYGDTQQKLHLKVRCNFFTVQVIMPWKSLPGETVESPSLEILQMNLDAILCHALCDDPAWSGKLDQMTYSGPFQPYTFWDSGFLWHMLAQKYNCFSEPWLQTYLCYSFYKARFKCKVWGKCFMILHGK